MIRNFNKIYLLSIVFLLIGFVSRNAYSQTRIALLYSQYSEKNPDINSHKIIDEITLWEIFLMQEKIPYKVIYDKDLESGITDDFDILILPNVSSISEDETNSIKKFLEDGNSVLSVGSRLNLDENGIYLDNQQITDLFGFQVEDFLGNEQSVNQLLHLNPFLTKNVKTSEFQVSTKFRPMICTQVGSNASQLGFIKDGNKNDSETSIVYGSVGSGKFVWMGFNIDDVVGGKQQSEDIKTFILNLLSWLDKTPDVWLENFPDNKKSATIIALENGTSLNPEFIDKLLGKGISPYLIITPHQTLTEDLQKMFVDENIILDLSNLSYIENDSSQFYTEEILNANKKFGFDFNKIIMPKKMIDDISLLNKIAETGISYFIYTSSSPSLPEVTKNGFFILPLHYYSGNNESGGITFLTYKPRIVCDGNPEEDFLTKVSNINLSNNWITDLKTLKDWWMDLSKLSVSLNSINKNSATINISYNGYNELLKLNIIFNWPYKFDPNYFSINEAANIIDYAFLKTGEIEISIDKLGSFQSKRLTVNFNQE